MEPDPASVNHELMLSRSRPVTRMPVLDTYLAAPVRLLLAIGPDVQDLRITMQVPPWVYTNPKLVPLGSRGTRQPV